MSSKTTKTWSQLVSRDTNNEENCLKPIPVLNNEKYISLEEVMSEQLANELEREEGEEEVEETKEDINGAFGGREEREERKERKESENSIKDENIKKFCEESGLDLNHVTQLLETNDCSCDELLAHLLQKQFDKQFDENLKRKENQKNQNSKVCLSYDLYKRRVKEDMNSDSSSDSSDEFHEYGEESKDWDSFEKSERMAIKVGKQGFAIKDGKVTTKHDLERSARINAKKVMEFSSDLKTGDGGGFDMKLSNNVYNALKVHSISEGKRMARLHEKKEKSTSDKVLDEKSRLIVYKLVNRGILESVNGIISTGKESVVLHAKANISDKGIQECEVAIKIFKTTLNEFKNRSQYICNDPILHVTSKLSKQNPKLMIPFWAEKEFHNLNRIKRSGILCPEVLILRKNVLVMKFIGKEGNPAPTLKEAKLSEEEYLKAWKQCVEMMCKLFKECDLIHSDLSEFNILWFEEKIWIIDVSQSVFSTHPMAFKFLWRDCNHIHKFFSKQCLQELMSARELFTKICGKQLDSENLENEFNSVDLLDKIESFDKNEEFLNFGENEDIFEDMLEKSFREKSLNKEVKNISGKSPPKSK